LLRLLFFKQQILWPKIPAMKGNISRNLIFLTRAVGFTKSSRYIDNSKPTATAARRMVSLATKAHGQDGKGKLIISVELISDTL